MSDSATRTAIETVASHSYGRLIAYLASRAGDVAGAEDALSDAFAEAFRRKLKRELSPKIAGAPAVLLRTSARPDP